MQNSQIAAAVALAALSVSSSAWGADCEALKSVTMPDVKILSADPVPAGDLTTSDKVTRKNLPAFCRVVASVADAPDSDVRVELWCRTRTGKTSST